MDFNSNKVKGIYSNRAVSDSWKDWAQKIIRPQAKVIADIGCGGGIYSKGFYELGAFHIFMVDGSQKYIEEVKVKFTRLNPTMLVNDCTKLDIESESIDIVFERALIHHLTNDQMLANLKEIRRILRPNGYAYIQDRTYQDVILEDKKFWIRNTLFECFPKLLEYEKHRRPDSDQYCNLVTKAGLEVSNVEKITEIRKEYSGIDDLCSEILKRKGKSILFELSDQELQKYCQKLEENSLDKQIVEQDSWTVWMIRKP